MKKMLKRHGKKISVMLLAIALMISPLLPIVKAANDDECKITYHYYFLEAENGWIDSKYTAKSEGDIEVGTNWQESSGTKDDNNNVTVTRRDYTSQYAVHFGITTDLYEDSSIIKDSNSAPYIKVKDQSHSYGNAITVAMGEEGFDHSTKKTYAKNNNMNMVSEAEFYNYQIPDGYTRVKSEEKAWDDDDWYTVIQMYVDGIKVADKGTLSAKDLVHNDGDDYYFVHFGWRNTSSGDNKYFSGTNVGDLDLKNSDTTGTLTSMFASWAANSEIAKSVKNSSVVQSEVSKLKAASFDVPTTIGIQNSADLGNPDLNSIATATIRREYGNLDKSKITFWETEANPEKIDRSKAPGGTEGLGNSAITISDTYHWYFFPKKLDVTFTAPADVCAVDTSIPGDEPGSGETNQKYGVVSYAIIGTLLVGAASAYIYARKNNKFNRL